VAIVRREGLVLHLSCAPIVSQFKDPENSEESTDSTTALQMHILRTVAPLLNLKPLRRLLELHDVTYDQSDRVRQLRTRLKSYLTRLKNLKYPKGQRTVFC
jgi:hypothetical protein